MNAQMSGIDRVKGKGLRGGMGEREGEERCLRDFPIDDSIEKVTVQLLQQRGSCGGVVF